MKKLFLILVFFFGLFFLKSVTSSNAFADQAVVVATFDNTSGTIPITVYYHFNNNNGQFSPTSGDSSVTVPAGSSLARSSDIDFALTPPYTATWRTSCTDPTAATMFSGNWGGTMWQFSTPSQDVHCPTTNSEPQITSTTCAVVNWTLVGIGTDGANIDHFLVFKSLGGNADLDSSPVTEPSSARSHNFGALSSSTWNVRVSAVSPQGQFSAPSYGSFTCGSSITPATNLSATPGCSGTTPKVDLTWTVATGATFDQQYVDMDTTNDGAWPPGTAVTVGVGSTTISGLAANTNYNWRVNTHVSGGNWYPSTTAFFTSIFCSAGSFNPATNLNQTTCWGGNADTVHFSWTNGSAPVGFSISQVWLDYAIGDPSFNPAFTVGTDVTGSSSRDITAGFVNGSTYYWRVNTLFSDGQWRPSITRSFVAPTPPCSVPPTPPAGGQGSPSPLPSPLPADIQLTGAADCSVNAARFHWVINSIPYPPPVWQVFEYTPSGGSATVFFLASQGSLYSPSPLLYRNAFNTTYRDFNVPFGASSPLAGTSSNGMFYSPANVTNTLGQSYTWRIGIGYNTPVLPDGSSSTLTAWSNYITITNPASCAASPDFGIQLTPAAPANQTIQAGQSTSYTVTITSFNGFASAVTLSHNLVVTGATISFAANPVTPPANLTTSTTLNVATITTGGTGTFNFTATGTSGALVHTASGILVVNPPPVIPNDPSNLTVATSCIGSGTSATPQLLFTWTDNANNEDLFWLDVSYDAFTGPSTTTRTPSVWGVKTRTSSAAEKSGVGSRSFTWNNVTPTTNTAGTLDAGDVDPLTAGNQLVPVENTTYFWRIKAHSNTGGDSNHIYPPSTRTPTGISVTTPNCVPKYDLSATFVAGSWKNHLGDSTQSFTAGEQVSVQIRVDHVIGKSTEAISPALPNTNGLSFWYKGANAGGNGAMPNCPTTGASVPVDGAAPVVSQGYAVPAITKGGNTVITVSFNVGSTTGTFTSYAYVLPSCSIPGGIDPDYTNNATATGFTYSVGVNTWYQTLSGDVGARTGTNVSQVPPVGNYQTDFLMASQSIGSNIRVNPAGWSVNNYTSRLVPSGGIYNYFADVRRRAMVTPNCIVTAAPAADSLYYCSGDITVGSAISISGGHNSAYFIDGNLNVNQNITVPIGTADTLIFIVQGDVNIDANVTQADGVYIAKRNFNSASGTPPVSQLPLVVHGAVFNDADTGSTHLSRILTPVSNNTTTAAEQFIYQPKYLVGLRDLLGKSAIAWKEVAP